MGGGGRGLKEGRFCGVWGGGVRGVFISENHAGKEVATTVFCLLCSTGFVDKPN